MLLERGSEQPIFLWAGLLTSAATCSQGGP